MRDKHGKNALFPRRFVGVVPAVTASALPALRDFRTEASTQRELTLGRCRYRFWYGPTEQQRHARLAALRARFFDHLDTLSNRRTVTSRSALPPPGTARVSPPMRAAGR